MLTTAAAARLLTQIATGQSVTRERSAQMMELMARDPFAQRDSEDQASGFTGIALPQGGKLWSKAGWTSQTRHDAAYVELPGGQKVVLVVFTENHANERGVIPAVAAHIFSKLALRPPP
jgi:beta-lactamase class A